MFVGSRRQLRVAMAVGDDGDVGTVVTVGWWCQVSWMVVGRKSLLMIDDAKLSVGMAIRKQYLASLVAYLLMVLWRSGKNATLFVHVMCPGVQCSILDVVTIFDYIYNGDSHGIPAEFQQNSSGIPQIPMGIIPRGSGILTISVGIPTFHSESAGTHGGG